MKTVQLLNSAKSKYINQFVFNCNEETGTILGKSDFMNHMDEKCSNQISVFISSRAAPLKDVLISVFLEVSFKEL